MKINFHLKKFHTKKFVNEYFAQNKIKLDKTKLTNLSDSETVKLVRQVITDARTLRNGKMYFTLTVTPKNDYIHVYLTKNNKHVFTINQPKQTD